MMSLPFNTLSKCHKCLLIPWLQSPSIVIWEPKKIKSLTAFISSPPLCHEVMGTDALILAFKCWVLSQLFHFLLSPSSRGCLAPLHFVPLGCMYAFALIKAIKINVTINIIYFIITSLFISIIYFFIVFTIVNVAHEYQIYKKFTVH